MKDEYRNKVFHFEGKPVFPGAWKLTADAASRYGLENRDFGSTEVLTDQPGASGPSFTVQDMQYPLGESQVGQRLIPVNDYGSVEDESGSMVNGSEVLDSLIRSEAGLNKDDPLYALVNYFHPEQNRGTILELATKSDKVETGFSHLGAYVGRGRTTNAPMYYHDNHFQLDGSADHQPFGYPAHIQLVSLDGVSQKTLNANILLVDRVLNTGVRFPGDYKASKFRMANINTALMFYRDWLDGKSYLRDDMSWFTYCAAHKTLVLTIALNLPHNLNAFQEIYGSSEGERLFEQFKALYNETVGPCPGFTKADETDFEALWKKQNLTADQISPFSLDEYTRYEDAREKHRLALYKGKVPVDGSLGVCWPAQSAADIVASFIQIYADFIDAGAVASVQVLLGFASMASERLGISKLHYLMIAVPACQKMMVADASVYASESPEQYRKNRFEALFKALGGKSLKEDEKEKWELKSADLHGAFNEGLSKLKDLLSGNLIKGEILPGILAALCMAEVEFHWHSIIEQGPVEKMTAYEKLMDSLEVDLKKGEAIVVGSDKAIQYNVLPAIPHLISCGAWPAGRFVNVRTICTVLDYTELEHSKK